MIIHKSKDIKSNCERDSYKVELSLQQLASLNVNEDNNGTLNKQHQSIIQGNFETLKQSITEEQVINEEEEDTRMFAVTMKIYLPIDNSETLRPLQFVEREFYPKLDDIVNQIYSSNYKSFLELLKATKRNIFTFYAISKEGERLTEMVQKFNFGGFTLLNQNKEDDLSELSLI
jgi:hypothetical protein